MYDYNKRISLPMKIFIQQLILGYQVKKKFANLVNYIHKTSEFTLETEDFKKE